MRSAKTVRVALALGLLILPGVAGAAGMWRWRDAGGRLHYSNIPAKVPGQATEVTGAIGTMSAGVPTEDPKAVQAELQGYRERHQQRVAPVQGVQGVGACGVGYPGYCNQLALPFLLTLNGSDLADQVKEAAVLDALNVKWRSGLCF